MSAVSTQQLERILSERPPIVPGRFVMVSHEVEQVGEPAGTPAEDEPTVELIRQEGQVVAIDIECTCGRRIRVQCDYGNSQVISNE